MKKTSVFETVKNYIGSEKFYGSIGEYIFWYIVTIFIATIVILIGAKAIDFINEIKANKEAERKAEEERKRKEEEREDLRKLREIYDEYFNSRIAGKVYKNLREVEQAFEKFHYNEFKQEASKRKLHFEDFNNFTNAVIRFRNKLERVYNY